MQQRDRLRAQSVLTGGPDTWLYIVALGAGLRCVGLAEVLGADVAAPRKQFDDAVADAKGVRDVIEHLEDYELGVGDLQVAGQRRLELLWCSSDQGVEYLELQGVVFASICRPRMRPRFGCSTMWWMPYTEPGAGHK